MTGRSYELPIVTFERLALRDMDQVHELGLEFAVQKKLEPSKMDEKYGITHTCEADAIPPTMVRDLFREAVEIWHDEQAYEGGLAQEDRDRADLRDWLARAA